MKKQNHKVSLFKMIPFFAAVFIASLEEIAFASKAEDIVYDFGNTSITRKAYLAQEELLKKFNKQRSESLSSDIEVLSKKKDPSASKLNQRLDYSPDFEREYDEFLASFQSADIKRLEKQKLYCFTEHIEEKRRLENGEIEVIQLGVNILRTLDVREREDLESVSRYNVSGDKFNCLFRCFALVNPYLREERGCFSSREYFVDYIRRYIGDQNVFDYLQEALAMDPRGHGARNVGEYLDAYYNDDWCIEPFRNIARVIGEPDPDTGEVFTIESADSGFPIILAYLSGVNLTVHTFEELEHTQLVIDYKHPESPDRTLNLLLVDSHYTVLAMPEDSENEILEMEALERENYYSIWCKHYGHVHSSSESNIFSKNIIEERDEEKQKEEKNIASSVQANLKYVLDYFKSRGVSQYLELSELKEKQVLIKAQEICLKTGQEPDSGPLKEAYKEVMCLSPLTHVLERLARDRNSGGAGSVQYQNLSPECNSEILNIAQEIAYSKNRAPDSAVIEMAYDQVMLAKLNYVFNYHKGAKSPQYVGLEEGRKQEILNRALDVMKRLPNQFPLPDTAPLSQAFKELG